MSNNLESVTKPEKACEVCSYFEKKPNWLFPKGKKYSELTVRFCPKCGRRLEAHDA